MNDWKAEALALIGAARKNADGCNWVWAFRAVDTMRRHIDVPYGIVGIGDIPDLDALERLIIDADTASIEILERVLQEVT